MVRKFNFKFRVVRSIIMYFGKLQKQLMSQVSHKPEPSRPHPSTGLVRAAAMRRQRIEPHANPTVKDPIDFAYHALVATLEVLRGTVRSQTVRSMLSASLYEQVRRQQAFNAQRAARMNAVVAPHRVSLRASNLCYISATVREVSVVFQDNATVRAGAIRLETFRGEWRVTALHIS